MADLIEELNLKFYFYLIILNLCSYRWLASAILNRTEDRTTASLKDKQKSLVSLLLFQAEVGVPLWVDAS